MVKDQVELYLSDSFAEGRGSGCLECRCRVLNINRGHNGELVKRCHRLWEYSECVSEVSEWLRKGKSREEAIQLAMDYCIEKGILRDILIKQRAEVLHMLLTEFDEKKYKRTIYSDGFEDGEQAGYTKGEQAGYTKGEQAGYTKGEQEMLRRLVQNKRQLGKDVAAIAEELGVEPHIVEKIVETAESET